MSFQGVADELYDLAPAEFTAARNARAAAARTAGDRDLAVRITALRKPTIVAWLANQLVRQNLAEIQALIALGEQLRAATAAMAGPELRRLATLEREFVQGLVHTARALAAARGLHVPDAADQLLADTLRATVADPDAARALLSGHLTQALEPPMFGALLPDAPPLDPGRPPAAPPGAGGPPDEQVHVDQARRDRQEARARADQALRARELTGDALGRAREAVSESVALVERLRAELDEAIEVRNAAECEERGAQATHDRAVRVADEAQGQLQAMTAHAPDS